MAPDSDTAAAPKAPAPEPAAPDRSEGARKRIIVAVTVVLTVWGAIFLSVFSIYVAGEATKLPAPVTGPRGPFPPTQPGPAGPHVPFIPPGPVQPGQEEPGHEGHGHAPGEHGKG